jgi:hypothetical protein
MNQRCSGENEEMPGCDHLEMVRHYRACSCGRWIRVDEWCLWCGKTKPRGVVA